VTTVHVRTSLCTWGQIVFLLWQPFRHPVCHPCPPDAGQRDCEEEEEEEEEVVEGGGGRSRVVSGHVTWTAMLTNHRSAQVHMLTNHRFTLEASPVLPDVR